MSSILLCHGVWAIKTFQKVEYEKKIFVNSRYMMP